MRILRSLDETAGFGPCALTIGNFDGVHAGHRRILRRVVELARQNGWKPAALTFDPHPTHVVAPERAPRLMTTPEQRARLMEEEGIEQVLVLPFTAGFAATPAEVFVRDTLRGRLDARAVLVGHNFRFGAGQSGDTRRLAELGREQGFVVEIVPAVTVRRRKVSSSSIRQLIERGEVSVACRLLERPFAVEGPVVRGKGIGSRETVPTLNLAPTGGLLPAAGVYITRTRDLDTGREWPSITNVGFRPTFEGDGLTIETFLLAPLEVQPQRIRVEFRRYLRPERKFADVAELKRQILHDAGRARAYHRRLHRKSCSA